MPEGLLSFGVMSTPGAAAHELMAEVANANLPRKPDAVCLLAPSNNLSKSRTIADASADFARLLATVCSHHENVSIFASLVHVNVVVVLKVCC